MPSRFPLGFFIIIVALALAGGAGLLSQRAQTLLLRGEVEAAQAKADELPRLRAENERLRARQISATELAALRADHNAVVRLRAELEALKTASAAKQP